MIELFERTLYCGGSLEEARLTLMNQANEERFQRNIEIEHDFKIATLIRECLLTEPKGSSGYAVSKGIMNRLKEKYRDPEAEKVVRKMRKEVKTEAEKEDPNNDGIDKKKRQTDSTGTEQAVVE